MDTIKSYWLRCYKWAFFFIGLLGGGWLLTHKYHLTPFEAFLVFILLMTWLLVWTWWLADEALI